MKTPSLPKAVKTAYSNNRLALLIGSGLSMGADVKGGFPKWGEVGERLLDYAVENGLEEADTAVHLRALIRQAKRLSQLLNALEDVKERLGDHYRDALTNLFRPEDADPGVAHKAVHALEVPALLTTNYDLLLEQDKSRLRLPYTWKQSPEALHDLDMDKPILFKVHGTAQDEGSIVLTRREYDDLDRDGSYKEVLSYLFKSHTFLFVGYGMDDPFDLDRILHSNKEAFRQAAREHFALMKGVSAKEAARYLEDFKVRVMSIDDHGQIVPFLKAIRGGRPTEEPPIPKVALSSRRKQDAKEPVPADELKAYLDKIEALHAMLKVAGFSTKLRVPIDLADLYVPLRAVVDLRAVGEATFADAKEAERRMGHGPGNTELSLPDAFKKCEMLNRRGFVILGDPGAGKTTHLKRVVLSCCREGPEKLGLPRGMVPVFLPLRELRDPKDGLAHFIQAQLDKNVELGTSKDFGTRLIERKNLLILLDGLDEVHAEADRKAVARWIEEALIAHPECRFVVTCRYAGYSEGVRLDAHFLELHIRPLDDDQVAAFVRNWYRIVEQGLSKDKAQAAATADKQATKLIGRLTSPEFQAASRVYEMTANPLLLANICLVHRDRGELPKRRAQLYSECIDVLLERWRAAKEMPVNVTADEGRRVLQPAALFMHEKENRTRVSPKELGPVIDPALTSIQWKGQGAAELLRTIRDESGLLTGWGDGTYGFMHLGFQEYLAARQIRVRALSGDQTVIAELAKRFGESWWQEVALLLLALEEPSLFEPYMREVVRTKAFVEHPELVDACFDDAAQVSLKPFLELVELPPGKDKALWARQLIALQIVARMDTSRMGARIMGVSQYGAGKIDYVERKLSAHPSPEIQRWLRAQRGVMARKTVVSEPGGYELVFIPGGEFLMGSPTTEGGRLGREGPQYYARVADFHLGRYPVTNEEYGRYLEANPKVAKPEYWGDRQYNQPRQPVVGVDWNDARAYCEWAGLRLPSEAEWEYACRAGTTMRYWSGDADADLARVGWYSGNSDQRLHPVGEKEPNPFGLHDMHGNVWEWVEDDWHRDYNGAPVDGSAWVGKERAERRGIRGGSWRGDAEYCRSAYRYDVRPGGRNVILGFRPARSIP